ncbi:hypothetical protein THAOC_19989, partial [Thalassiosira oceanica]
WARHRQPSSSYRAPRALAGVLSTCLADWRAKKSLSGPGIASRHRPIVPSRARHRQPSSSYRVAAGPASPAVIVLSSHRGEIDLVETPNYPSSRAPDVAPWSPLRRLDVYRRSSGFLQAGRSPFRRTQTLPFLRLSQRRLAD